MPGLGLAIIMALPPMPVADPVSQAARRVATTVAQLAVVLITAAACPAAADSTAVAVVDSAADTAAAVGSAVATVVAAADTGKASDRRKRLASASRFLLCGTSIWVGSEMCSHSAC